MTAAAAGLPQIPQLSGEARSYAERLFDFPTIGNLDESAARAAFTTQPRVMTLSSLRTPSRRRSSGLLGTRFTSSSLESTPGTRRPRHRSPLRTCETPSGPRSSHLTEASMRCGSSAPQRMSVATCARWPSLGGGPYRTGDVAAALGQNTGQASPTRQQLLDKGLIYATEEYGFIDFTVPRFDEFMRRLMPFTPGT